VLGGALLAASISVGAATSAAKRVSSRQALKGGTLRVNLSGFDFDFVDPQLAYDTDDWSMLDTTAMTLLGYPDKAGPAGAQLVPMGATSYPSVSRDGRTYTFHIRPGLRFSDGSTEQPVAINRAQVAELDLRQAGFQVKDVPTPATTFGQVVGTRGTTYNFTSNGGWCADYFDAFDFINVLFDGRTIQAKNNVAWTYFNDAGFNKQLDAASLLSGRARVKAYARLDFKLMTKYVPVVPYLIQNDLYLTSARVHNWIYSDYFGAPYLNALAVG
jgi:ABC-type transport system substrate-binding protein